MSKEEQLDNTKKLTNAIIKLAKVVGEENYFSLIQLEQPIFRVFTSENANKLQYGQIVVRATNRTNEYAFGFIVKKDMLSIDVCFCDEKKPDNIETYNTISPGHLSPITSTGHKLFVCDLLVDEFVLYINRLCKQYKNLDKRAKITNREYLELKKEIKELKKFVYEFKKKKKEDEEISRALREYELMDQPVYDYPHYQGIKINPLSDIEF